MELTTQQYIDFMNRITELERTVNKSNFSAGLNDPPVDAEKILQLILTLDQLGRKRDPIEYGLPFEDYDSMTNMREAVYEWLKGI